MAIRNTSEIAGMAQQSGTEAFNKVLQAGNMQETLEDLRTAMTKQPKKVGLRVRAGPRRTRTDST